MSYFFAFFLFWAPSCLVVGAKKYFFGAVYKNSDGTLLQEAFQADWASADRATVLKGSSSGKGRSWRHSEAFLGVFPLSLGVIRGADAVLALAVSQIGPRRSAQ